MNQQNMVILHKKEVDFMKKSLTIFFIFIFVLNMMVVPVYGIEPEDMQSRSAILINADDGKILFEKNANDKSLQALPK
jgi:D-alanyl-D-alanine carboxypeptidase